MVPDEDHRLKPAESPEDLNNLVNQILIVVKELNDARLDGGFLNVALAQLVKVDIENRSE